MILATGIGLYGRREWARGQGLVLVMLSAIANFFFIPYYPVWALRRDRARRLGDLGADAAGRDPDVSR